MNFTRVAVLISAVVFTLPFTAPNLFVADKDDIVATIHQFADNLDPRTMDKALAACDRKLRSLMSFLHTCGAHAAIGSKHSVSATTRVVSATRMQRSARRGVWT
jgi:hypothetical protein